jgi:hypothetical protein
MKALQSIAFLFRRASGGAMNLAVLAALFLAAASGSAKSHRVQAGGDDEMGYPTNSAKALALGQLEARRDLSDGVMIVKTAGLPPPSRDDYEHLLKERCNVKLEPVAGCVVSSGLLAYMQGYNEISGAAIKQKFGTNIFERLNVESETRWHNRQKADDPPAGKGEYLVKSGDTLTKIAHAHGVKLNDLLQANPGVNPSSLQVRQLLVIPQKKQQ